MSVIEKLKKGVAVAMGFFMLVSTSGCATTSVRRSTSVDPRTGQVEERVEESDPQFIKSATSLLIMGVVIAGIFLAAGAAGYYDDDTQR